MIHLRVSEGIVVPHECHVKGGAAFVDRAPARTSAVSDVLNCRPRAICGVEVRDRPQADARPSPCTGDGGTTERGQGGMVAAPRKGQATGESDGQPVETATDPEPERPTKSADPSNRVGTVVRRLREERGISLRDLGARAHISRMQLWRVEQLESSPTEERIRSLAKALDVPVGVLFGDPDPALLRAKIGRTLTCLTGIEGELRGLLQSTETSKRETPSRLAADGGCVMLMVEGRNRVGIVRDITGVIAEGNGNITKLHAVLAQGTERCAILIDIEMAQPKQEERIIQQIGRIGGVEKVYMIEDGETNAQIEKMKDDLTDGLPDRPGVFGGEDVAEVIEGVERMLKEAHMLKESSANRGS